MSMSGGAIGLCLPCFAMRPPPPPAFVLDGACAGVKSSDSWKDNSGKSHWSYRIKVQSWTVFGRVHVELHGWGMQVRDIYSGDVDEKAKSFWVTLHPEHSAGPDSTFQIEGDGEPYAHPALSCEGLHQVIALATRPLCIFHPCIHGPFACSPWSRPLSFVL